MKNIKIVAIVVGIMLLFAGCKVNNQPKPVESDIGADDKAKNTDNVTMPYLPSDTQVNREDVLVISEKMFLTQIIDIKFNFDNYKNKTIVVEGMFKMFSNQDGTQNIPAVYRRGPGCCGNDGGGGFFLKFDGELPKDNDWIKVTGKPELVKNGDFNDLYLNVTKLEVLEKRGAEFVQQ